MRRLLLFMFVIVIAQIANAQCTDLFISEYVEGSFNNKALEIYNPTANTIYLTNYRIIRWSNGSTTSDTDPAYVLYPTGSIAPHDVKVFVIDKRDSLATGQDTMIFPDLEVMADTFVCPDYVTNSVLYFNGDDALSLQKNNGGTWSNIDIFGKIGERPTNSSGTTSPVGAWTDTPPYNDGQGAYISKDLTLIRKASVQTGVTVNPAMFNALAEWDTLPENTFTQLQLHTCDCFAGINENDVVKVSYYPNPVTDHKLYIKAEKQIINIKVSNLIGQEIFTVTNENKSSDMILQLNNIENGIYLVKVYFDNNISTVRKIVIQ